MEVLRSSWWLLLVPAASLAGCIGDGVDGTVEPTALTDAGAFLDLPDPEGDARLMGAQYMGATAQIACRVAWSAYGACLGATEEAAGAVPDEATEPAPPAADITAARLTETREALIVELELASLDPGFGGVPDPDHRWRTVYAVCWGEYVRGTTECVSIAPELFDGRVVIDLVEYGTYSPRCNWWWWCSWNVDAELTYGTPGTITWTVPRALLPNGTRGDTLDSIEAEVLRYGGSYGVGAGYSVDAPVHALSGVLTPFRVYHVDLHDEVGEFTFELEAAVPASATTPGLVFTDEAGEPEADDLDVLTVELVETPDALTIATKVALVEEEPEDHRFYAALGLPSGRVLDIGYAAAGGKREAYAGQPEDIEYEQYSELPVELEVVEGSPGWIRFTLQRSDIEPLATGDRMNLFYVELGRTTSDLPAWSIDEQAGPAALSLGLPARTETDWSGVLPFYVFVYSSAGTSEQPRE